MRVAFVNPLNSQISDLKYPIFFEGEYKNGIKWKGIEFYRGGNYFEGVFNEDLPA